MKRSTKDTVSGKLHEVRGSVKQKLGRAVNDRRLGKPKASLRRFLGRSKRRSAKWRKSSGNDRCSSASTGRRQTGPVDARMRREGSY